VSEFGLSSDAFAHRDEIPRRHTCEGEDVSPSLSWSDPPTGTRSLALVVDDPDAPVGTFTHWLAWNIDPAAGGLGEGEPAPAEGRNDFGIGGWSRPCAPPGHGSHRYFFRLHALDAKLDVGFRAGRRELERALASHLLATAELMGGTSAERDRAARAAAAVAPAPARIGKTNVARLAELLRGPMCGDRLPPTRAPRAR
jgi:Raf kinase inhibitor-like YbhB/YbcL family protein